jgi:ATP-dependent Lon protease
LDSEQNKTFRDHFVELPFDLSDCLFIATANTLDTIPRPLLDRMEVIELQTYTKNEKLSIAKNHLLTKQLSRHGLNRRMLSVSDGAILEIIDYYTREAGVRNLERAIADLARKAAKRFVEDPTLKRLKITERDIPEYLGIRKMLPEQISECDEIGVVNGLAYTQVGGDLLAQLTGGTQHQRLQILHIGVEALDEGNAESASLTGAGGRLGDDIAAIHH